MTSHPLTAHTFAIRSRDSGQFIGQAVLCLKARYVSIQWAVSVYPDRRFATVDQWVAIEQELGRLRPPASLDDASSIAHLLVGKLAGLVSVQHLGQEILPGGLAPATIISELDQRLRLVHA